ncbi:hypothetical protein ACO0K0_17730 [Undibacterium sp. SXout11W]|uniref:hypothetical protein n=1 Tax=Undibacterium sp. SXout11W TaxID=3413050 RepID=UPI003BF2A066
MATVTSKKEAPIAKATAAKAPALKVAAVKAPVAKKIVAKKPVVASEKRIAHEKPVAKVNGAGKAPVRRVAAKVDVPKSAVEIVDKVKKAKLIRDSFTMPEAEYAVLGHVKRACLKAGVEVKKSQLLRIGLALLNKTDVPALKKLIGELAPLKAGRPKKEK